MSRWFLSVPVVCAAIVAAGCFMGSNDTPDAGSALPCDVAQALSVCQACHGPTLAASAPFTLVSYGDLTQPSPQYPDQTVAQRVVARMSDTTWPMPPHPLDPSPQSDIDTIQAWIDANYPGGTCTPPPGGTNPFDTPSTCTMGQSTVTQGSELMYPGGTCIACHVQNNGPHLVIAGTVYPTAHETLDCNGSNIPSASVIVTDSNNVTYTLHPNGAGNFYLKKGAFTPPYTVQLTYQGRERDMTGLITAPTDGDCNNCHTPDGANGAPGRIMLP